MLLCCNSMMLSVLGCRSHSTIELVGQSGLSVNAGEFVAIRLNVIDDSRPPNFVLASRKSNSIKI